MREEVYRTRKVRIRGIGAWAAAVLAVCLCMAVPAFAGEAAGAQDASAQARQVEAQPEPAMQAAAEDGGQAIPEDLASLNNGIPVVYVNIDESDEAIAAAEAATGETYGTIKDMNESQRHTVRCTGSVSIRMNGYTGGWAAPYEDLEDLQLSYIRGRGNSTWGFDKNPYKLKFEDKQNFFGMGADKEWALMANYYDETRLRNSITLWLGQQMGLPYTPRLVPVDVVMTGTKAGSEYLGTYCLSELVDVGQARVNIDKSEGLLLACYNENQKSDDAANIIKTDAGLQFTVKSPAASSRRDGLTAEMQEYLQELEDLILSAGDASETPEEGDETAGAKAGTAAGAGTGGAGATTAAGSNVSTGTQTDAATQTGTGGAGAATTETGANADVDTQPGAETQTGTGGAGTTTAETGTNVSYGTQPGAETQTGSGTNVAPAQIDAATHERIAAMMDLQTAADYWLIQEFCRNGDAYNTDSTNLFRDKDGKLCWGPLWDFDLAWGAGGYDVPKEVPGFNSCTFPWINALRQYDPQFDALLAERWELLSQRLDQLTMKGGVLDQMADEINASWWMDWDKNGDETEKKNKMTFRKYIEILRGWIKIRQQWFDANIQNVDKVCATITYQVDGKPYKTVQRYLYGTLWGEPRAPKKTGLAFVGWYDANGVHNDDITVTDDLTLEAKYLKANPLKAKAKKAVTVKAKTLKKKSVKLKRAKTMQVSGGKGKVTYQLVSVSKKKYAKKFKVDQSTGKITIGKKVPKGLYKLEVDIDAAGNQTYAPRTKTVTVKIRVK